VASLIKSTNALTVGDNSRLLGKTTLISKGGAAHPGNTLTSRPAATSGAHRNPEVIPTWREDGGQGRHDRQHPGQRTALLHEHRRSTSVHALHVYARWPGGVLHGDQEPCREPYHARAETSKGEQAEFLKKAEALAPTYRSELLNP
jgi:hypothetical protein